MAFALARLIAKSLFQVPEGLLFLSARLRTGPILYTNVYLT